MGSSPQTPTKTGEGTSLKENQGVGTRKRGKDAEHGGNHIALLFLRLHLSICKMRTTISYIVEIYKIAQSIVWHMRNA